MRFLVCKQIDFLICGRTKVICFVFRRTKDRFLSAGRKRDIYIYRVFDLQMETMSDFSISGGNDIDFSTLEINICFEFPKSNKLILSRSRGKRAKSFNF